MDRELADEIVGLLETLDDQGVIDRCNHRSCGRLAVGLPDFGPSVEAPVCERHVPRGASLIASLEDSAAALRRVYAALEPYGYCYDPETGKRTS